MKDLIKLRSFYLEYFKNVEKKIIPSTSLRSVSMDIPTTSGEYVNINAVARDNMPNGSDIGCVVAIHDVPGNDKSYLSLFNPFTKKGIRFLAINLPGFGYSSYDNRLKCTSNERLIFTKKICDELIHPKEKIIFMGLGRGCETVIKMTHDYYDKNCIGCVLVSPYGIKNDHLRDHTFLYYIFYLFSLIKYFGSHQLKPLLDITYDLKKSYYNDVHISKIHGSKIMRRTIKKIDFSTLPPYLEGITKQKQKFSLIYGGMNKNVKPESSLSLTKFTPNCKFFKIIKGNEKGTINKIEEFYKEGIQNVAVNVLYSKHKVQKASPKFIADLCEKMLQNSK